MLQLGRTASRMAAGGVAEKTRRLAARAEQNLPHALLNRKNAALLADRLARLRGAAMKLGQMLSLEGDNLLPAEFARALESLQANADRMPKEQVERVLKEQYGPGWQSRFREFDFVPIASASIGQVHRARTHQGEDLAIKLQYPGVAESVESDVDNLIALIKLTRLVPPELDLAELSREVKRQLNEEVDYARELKHQLRYQALVEDIPGLRVPKSFPEFSTQRVLATELVNARPLLAWGKSADAEMCNRVGKTLLELLLRELFQFRFMQTDPNPGNYLFDGETNTVILLDFGASRMVPDPVSDLYREVLRGIALRERATLEQAFSKLGVLHHNLSAEAKDIIVNGALYLSEVLSTDHPFDFGTTDLAQRMHLHAKKLRQYRSELRPPPLSYLFFQRKLGGAFLISRQLGARVNCHQLLFDVGVLARGRP